jgi:hypothetical protein
MPCGISFAESIFRRQAIDRIDDLIAALRRGGAGAEADALTRGAAQDDGLDALGLQTLIEIVVEKFVGPALLLVHQFALARREARIDRLAVARQGEEHRQAGTTRLVLKRLQLRHGFDAARTRAAILRHEIEQKKGGGLVVDRDRLQLWRRRHLDRRPLADEVGSHCRHRQQYCSRRDHE